MVNPFKEINWRPSTAEKRKFALSLAIGFPCVALVFLLVGRWTTGSWNPTLALWLGGCGAILGLFLRSFPRLALPFYLLWYGVGCSVGIVVSNLLLAGFYYLAIAPIGLLLRISGRKLLRKSFEKQRHTYWQDAEPITDLRRYYSQF